MERELKCYLCDGPHMVRGCPKKNALNAIRKKLRKGSDSSTSESEAEQLASVQFLGAVSKKNAKREESRSSKGVLYVDAKVNGVESKALVDTGATHNFVSTEEAKRLGLKVKQEPGWSKGVNAELRPIKGVVRSADITIILQVSRIF